MIGNMSKNSYRYFHLSTYIILVWLCCLLLLMNVRREEKEIEYLRTERGWYARFDADVYGWPVPFLTKLQDPDAPFVFSFLPVAIDLLFSVAVLIICYFMCEWLIRRRNRR